MPNILTRGVRKLVHASADFDAYFAGLQRRCIEGGFSGDCDGIPSIEQARRDYRHVRDRVNNVKHLYFG